MTTVNDLIDRAYRDWLYPPDDQPAQSLLTVDIDASTDQVAFNPALFGGALAALGPGQTVEVGTELMLLIDVDDDAGIFTVARHHEATTAAAHSAGDRITVPRWSRQTMFDAMADSIDGLHPRLWRTSTLRINSSRGYFAAPPDMVSVLGRHVSYDPHDPAGGYGMLTVTEPGPAYLAYRARYLRPTNPTDILEKKLFIADRHLHRLIIVGAVADVIQVRDVAASSIEFITDALEAQQVPVGSSTDIRNALLAYRQVLLDEAEARQLVNVAPQVETLAW